MKNETILKKALHKAIKRLHGVTIKDPEIREALLSLLERCPIMENKEFIKRYKDYVIRRFISFNTKEPVLIAIPFKAKCFSFPIEDADIKMALKDIKERIDEN